MSDMKKEMPTGMSTGPDAPMMSTAYGDSQPTHTTHTEIIRETSTLSGLGMDDVNGALNPLRKQAT